MERSSNGHYSLTLRLIRQSHMEKTAKPPNPLVMDIGWRT